MAKRSIKASPAGIQRAKRAFALTGWTQEDLAAEVNIKTRQPIWRFFTGQPVDRQIFMEICHRLDLEWREVAEDPPAHFLEPEEALPTRPGTVDDLVITTRAQRYDTLQHQCGILQLLDIGGPVNIDDIYVDVNILEVVPNQQCLEVTALNALAPTEFDRVGLGGVDIPQIPGIEAVETYAKLRVLGKPGVGKTTFLQRLAVRCNQGEFAANQVPIFLALREFADVVKRQGEASLFSYLCQVLLSPILTPPSDRNPANRRAYVDLNGWP